MKRVLGFLLIWPPIVPGMVLKKGFSPLEKTERNHLEMFKPEEETSYTLNKYLSYGGFIQLRTDCGELLFQKDHFTNRCDSFIRRAELKFKFQPTNRFYIFTKLAADNLFRNYYGGKKRTKPKKIVFKKLYLAWKADKKLLLEVGRDKKPFSRIGLSSSERTLLADKAELFLKFKKAVGDYYATQLEILLKPLRGWRLYAATAYSWSLKDKNLLKGTYNLSEDGYWLNNLWGRIEYSPKGWEERKRDNTTFGKKALSIGVSAAGFWNLNVYTPGGKRDVKMIAREADFFFRSPRWVWGRLTLLGEYEKVKYLVEDLPDSSLEGFDLQIGLRPGRQKLWELGVDYEDIQQHPGGKREEIYRAGFNLYPVSHIKVSYTFSYTDWRKKFADKPQRVHTLELQLTF